MTEQLADLLHREAETLSVPRPATAEILSRGRGLRRRRAWRRAGAGALVVAVLAAGASYAVTRDGDGVDPARAADAFASEGAFAVGRDLYLGDQEIRWPEPVKALYYTSAGVVIRSGESSDTNEGASHYTLLTPAGDQSVIHVTMGDRIAGFEPDSSRFAYATQDTGRLEVVVHDVVSDRELARVTVRDTPVATGWEAPPVSIDGDLVWVRTTSGWTEVDWRTGTVRDVPDTEDTFELQNGRYAVQRGHVWQIRTLAGSPVGEVDLIKGWYAFFAPDGRYLRAFPNEVRDAPEDPSAWVYDPVTGASYEHRSAGYDLGWTPDGHLLVLDGDTVRICAPLSDECTVRAFDGTGTVRLGGAPYES